MKVHYRILDVFPAEHSILVRYYTDVLTEEYLRTDPEDTNNPPLRCRTDYYFNLFDVNMDEDALHDFLMQMAPVQWLGLQEKIVAPEVDTSLSHIEKLKGKKFSKEVQNPLDVEKDDIEAAEAAVEDKVETKKTRKSKS